MINPDDIKAGYTLGHADAQILRDAVKELIALRKAFSEPVCCIEPPELDYLSRGDDARVYWPKAAEHGDILLYRKPPNE